MKRDMDIIRNLLIELEDASGLIDREDPSGAYHITLILDADLAKGAPCFDGQGMPVHGTLTRLTWAGHEFLDAMRDDTIWKKVKEKALAPAASWTFSILLEYARIEIKSRLGI
ncbi:MAG: DUF2513 domain-containing protein [Lentisphaeria bacterium]